MVIQIALIFLLALLALQDFRFREVSVLLFPLITVLFLWMHLKEAPWAEITHPIIFCCLFILFQLGLLAGYFLIRYRNLRLLRGALGIGDVLFMCSLCFLFSPVNFIAFHLISLITGLAFALVARLFSRTQKLTIPLAGLQASLVIAIMLYNLNVKPITIFSDRYLLDYLCQ